MGHGVLLLQVLVPFVFWISHHKVVRRDQNKYEDGQEVGEEIQVLIVKRL
jgi:hypothetical protein